MSLSPDSVPFQELLQRQKDMAKDQLAAAWKSHVARVEELLQKGWTENLAHLLEERLRVLSEEMEGEFQRRLSVRQAEVRAQALADAEKQRAQARQQQASDLNQTARRLAQAGDAAEWVTALLDALQPLSGEAAFFSLASEKLKCEAARPNPAAVEMELKDAAAFASVQETRDTVVAAVSANELSEPVLKALDLAGRERVYLLPVTAAGGGQLAGIVLASPAGAEFDLNTAELLCTMAGPLRKQPQARTAGGATITAIAPAAGAARSREEEEMEQRAQRFARVRVAEMRLYHSPAVTDGRTRKDLYSVLKSEIDKARQQYKDEFLKTPGLADHLHEELIRTLANGDATLMGAGYPGAQG